MPIKDPILRKRYEQERYLANREERISQMRKWREDNPDKMKFSRRSQRLKKNFGLTIQQYEAILESQKGVCAICQKECTTGVRLAVDHDHKTGKVRGLLCWKCNTMLGKMGDSVELLTNAIHYLQGNL